MHPKFMHSWLVIRVSEVMPSSTWRTSNGVLVHEDGAVGVAHRLQAVAQLRPHLRVHQHWCRRGFSLSEASSGWRLCLMGTILG